MILDTARFDSRLFFSVNLQAMTGTRTYEFLELLSFSSSGGLPALSESERLRILNERCRREVEEAGLDLIESPDLER